MLCGEGRNLRGCGGGVGGRRPEREAEERREMAEVGDGGLLDELRGVMVVGEGRSSTSGQSSASIM